MQTFAHLQSEKACLNVLPLANFSLLIITVFVRIEARSLLPYNSKVCVYCVVISTVFIYEA